MTATRRTALALVWLIVLIGAGVFISGRLQVSGDLRKFMPSAETPAQKLLLDELGEGPGSRLLLMSLAGADAETLAAQSQQIAQTLAAMQRRVVASILGVGLLIVAAVLYALEAGGPRLLDVPLAAWVAGLGGLWAIVAALPRR